MRGLRIRLGGLLLMAVTATGCGTTPSGASALLAPCPRTPNCVSTMATDSHAIAPMHYTGSRADALARLLTIIRGMPRAKVVATDETSIRAEFRTRIFRFVDDSNFVLDDSTKTIHFRSAARLGRRDFNVNRDRMEEIRKAYEGR